MLDCTWIRLIRVAIELSLLIFEGRQCPIHDAVDSAIGGRRSRAGSSDSDAESESGVGHLTHDLSGHWQVPGPPGSQLERNRHGAFWPGRMILASLRVTQDSDAHLADAIAGNWPGI